MSDLFKYPRGSEWRKWDLHVHTPFSIHHRYTGTNVDEQWEGFLTDLEGLPHEFKVLGINDYIFLDGYRRMLEAKGAGRLKNIERIFPVIELRLDKFGGSDSKLRRVNFHVIFSNDVNPDLIESQFLAALRAHYALSPEYGAAGVKWNAIPDRNSLRELGEKIIRTVPAKERPKFGDPLVEGFNALNLSLDVIHKALEHHNFISKYITAVGKTEWSSVKWNDQAIAEKKQIINGVDAVFIAAESIESYYTARQSLADQNVNSRLFDCSDSHVNSSVSEEKDRIGSCFTWVKADPTFEGLKMAIKEFDDRVFVGEKPPVLKRVQENSTKYIRSITISKVAGSTLKERWFYFEKPLELNSGLVAIIGNKGSGKSALTDTIGLLGGTKHAKAFSFLCDTKFRDPKNNKAKHFEATLLWESGPPPKSINLNEDVSRGQIETIKYIPQNYLEQICNELTKPEEGEFDREIKAVIFSHVPGTETLGFGGLDEFVGFKTQEAARAIELLRSELHEINEKICHLEERLTPEYADILNNKLSEKLRELETHDKTKPVEIKPPGADPKSQEKIASTLRTIEEKQTELDTLTTKIAELKNELSSEVRREVLAKKVLEQLANLSKQFEKLVIEINENAKELGLHVESIVELRINDKEARRALKDANEKKNRLTNELNPKINDSTANKIDILNSEIEGLRKQLDKPNQEYQAYLKALKLWEEKRAAIVGDTRTIGSVEYLKKQQSELQELPGRLGDAMAQRLAKAKEIYHKISNLADDYRKLYKPIKDSLRKLSFADKLDLDFQVFIASLGFEEKFFGMVNQRKTGTFYGIEEGTSYLRKFLAEIDFDNDEGIEHFLTVLIDSLTHDHRDPKNPVVQVKDQIKKGVSVLDLYDFIFDLEFLAPRYVLQWGGKNLDILSPGERGILLLIFYLLIDRTEIPLVIDQPEGNLDNQTVFKTLVQCIKEAKKRRQIIMVTHNPNLAVVCDAEQVICADLNKEQENKVTYISGAIENPYINQKILDILEGTRPAFDNRDFKYEITRGIETS